MTGRTEGAPPARPVVTGVVLAAGAGRRFGGPKALVPGWLADRCSALADGGCTDVVVVLGASASEASRLVPPGARVVVARDWERGLSASLAAGLAAARDGGAVAALVVLVDTPGLTARAVERVLEATRGSSDDTDLSTALAQATYDGVPGHPVLLGRGHWDAVLTGADGDRGARDHLSRADALRVPCEDVADGRDVDVRAPGPP
ncbi:NTP transferase domain-containing protein [Actinotalea sp. Marseille-Q4924]|uniref:nucleotidyltransferase family protein n=1 Tax=Actinotalea sp. Marseille-Q4924 TaxID=2866571 RepID=UPI001CE3FA4F|nr:NTP transferase domain-containing protein [Actinotalea sp. Marseille-Q4924]